MDRNCENCANHSDRGCSKWECEFALKQEESHTPIADYIAENIIEKIRDEEIKELMGDLETLIRDMEWCENSNCGTYNEALTWFKRKWFNASMYLPKDFNNMTNRDIFREIFGIDIPISSDCIGVAVGNSISFIHLDDKYRVTDVRRGEKK